MRSWMVWLLTCTSLAGCTNLHAASGAADIGVFEGTATYETPTGIVRLNVSVQESLWHGGQAVETIRASWEGDLEPFTRTEDVEFLSLVTRPCGGEGLQYEIRDGVASYRPASPISLPPIQAFFGRSVTAPSWNDTTVRVTETPNGTETSLHARETAWKLTWDGLNPVPIKMVGPRGQAIHLKGYEGNVQATACSLPPRQIQPEVQHWTPDGPAADLGIDPPFRDVADHARSDPTLVRLMLFLQAYPDAQVAAGRATGTTALDGSPGAYTWTMHFGSPSSATGIRVTCQETGATFTCGESETTAPGEPAESHADLTDWSNAAELLLGRATGLRFSWSDGRLDVHFDSAVADPHSTGTTRVAEVHIDGSSGRLIDGYGHLDLGAMDWRSP